MNPSPASILPAQIAFKDGALYSPRYADIYHSVEGAIAEVRHVFLKGNALPDRWQASSTFTIVETGFGCGLNFLTAWDALEQSGAACRLDFVSVEKHPFTRDDLAGILGAWPQLDTLSGQLLDVYPPLVPGFHRLHLAAGRISLTLLFGEAADMLAELDARADAFFLDGFAPSRNADMWSDALFKQIGRIATSASTAATYSAAASVVKGLELAGFTVAKRAGFARKRDMLTARVPGDEERLPDIRKSVVIGAGIAGASCAHALARRGIEVELLDREPQPGSAASANPAAVVRPFLSLDAGARNRFSWAAFLYAVRLYRDVSRQASFNWHETGVLQLARSRGHRDKLKRAVEMLAYPADLVRLVDAQQATDLCGVPVNEDGVWFPAGGFVDGQVLCAALVSSIPQLVHFYGRVDVGTLHLQDELIQLAGAEDRVMPNADAVVLANGPGAAAFIAGGAPWLRAARGQVTQISSSASQLRAPVCREGYVTPQIQQRQVVGATFDESRAEALITEEDQRANLRRAARILPDVFGSDTVDAVAGWAGVRCVSRDRLPVIGELDQGLYCSVAMGSRGFSWAPLAAEMIASIAARAPVPVERSVLQSLLPARFSK